jgi:GNAT superfamily N-acetyltransferase
MTTLATERALFEAGLYGAVELAAADIAEFQRFFEANPEYFRIVNGEEPGADAANRTFHGVPPDEMTYTRKWMIAFRDEEGAIAGIADVIEDLVGDDVWHIGLFIVATRLHGSGAARAMYDALERWMRSGGARWLRLGVVAGNPRAGRFWEKAGYREIRTRAAVRMGERVHLLRVMMKPLGAGSEEEYLQLVPRDNKGAA